MTGLKLSVSEMKVRQTGENNHSAAAMEDNECIVREQDRFMPIANVIRIMRKILPPHASLPTTCLPMLCHPQIVVLQKFPEPSKIFSFLQ